MKKVLKNLEPSIRTYLGDAFCFSIIDDHAFRSGWVYDKYIHLEYTAMDGQIKYADYDYYDFVPDQGVFIKSFIEYPYSFCNENVICDQIIQMIGNHEYCFALWDELVVTNFLFHEKEKGEYEHGCFVYGYDSEERVFYMQGYLQDNIWEHFCVPFHVFYKAISYCPEKEEIALIGYKVKEDYKWNFDYDKMRTSLDRYVKYSTNPDNNFDLNAIIKFFSHLIPGKMIHYPSLYCVYEQKTIFKKRIIFLIQEGYIKEDSILEKVKKLEQISRKILLLGIRYNTSFEMEIFDLMFHEVKKMITAEKEILPARHE